MTEQTYCFIKRKELTEQISLSQSKIKQLIRSGEWIEGVHFTRYSSRMNLFNLRLIQDWLANHHDPTSHQRAIENFLNTLPSNRGRKAKVRAGQSATASKNGN
jgi:hypothetical protein